MKKNTYHHGDLRHSLLDTATTLLHSNGIAGLSLRAVAKAAGVSHSAPYRHFRDKNALLEAIAQEGYDHLRDANLSAITDYPDDPVKQLYHAGRAYLFLVVKQPEITKLMFSGVLQPKNWGHELKESSQESVNVLMKIIENGKNSGIFADRSIDELTLTTLSTVHGLSMTLAAGLFSDTIKTEADIDKLGSCVYETLLSGLLKR